MARDGLTTVMVVTADSDEPDATAYCRGWIIPHASAEAFAEAMTERYGPPIHEAVNTVAALVAKAEQSDSVVITSGGADA